MNLYCLEAFLRVQKIFVKVQNYDRFGMPYASIKSLTIKTQDNWVRFMKVWLPGLNTHSGHNIEWVYALQLLQSSLHAQSN